MSEFAVYRTLGNGFCLVLDDTRIAGGKPDYRGNNYVTSWRTNETYGPIDALKAENAKLREERNHWHVEQAHAYGNWEDTYKRAVELELENAKLRKLCKDMLTEIVDYDLIGSCRYEARMRELGIESNV